MQRDLPSLTERIEALPQFVTVTQSEDGYAKGDGASLRPIVVTACVRLDDVLAEVRRAEEERAEAPKAESEEFERYCVTAQITGDWIVKRGGARHGPSFRSEQEARAYANDLNAELCRAPASVSSPVSPGRDWLFDVIEVLGAAYDAREIEVWLSTSKDPRDESLLDQRTLIEEEGMGANVLAWAEQSVGRTLNEIRAGQPTPPPATPGGEWTDEEVRGVRSVFRNTPGANDQHLIAVMDLALALRPNRPVPLGEPKGDEWTTSGGVKVRLEQGVYLSFSSVTAMGDRSGFKLIVNPVDRARLVAALGGGEGKPELTDAMVERAVVEHWHLDHPGKELYPHTKRFALKFMRAAFVASGAFSTPSGEGEQA